MSKLGQKQQYFTNKKGVNILLLKLNMSHKNQPIIEGWEEKLEDIDSNRRNHFDCRECNGPLIISAVTEEVDKLLQQQANKSYRQGIEDAINEIKDMGITDVYGEPTLPSSECEQTALKLYKTILKKLESLKDSE